MKEGAPEIIKKNKRIEKKRFCSECGKLLSIYNTTNKCHSHNPSGSALELYERMPQPSSEKNLDFSRGKRTLPHKTGTGK